MRTNVKKNAARGAKPETHARPPRGAFLPVSMEDVRARGWDGIEILIITGDAYVDHPSFGHAIIARWLEAHGFRCEIDTRSEKIGYKIREAQLEKLPYMLIIGDKEKEEGTVSVRMREKGDIGAMPLSEFAARVKKENDEKTVF